MLAIRLSRFSKRPAYESKKKRHHPQTENCERADRRNPANGRGRSLMKISFRIQDEMTMKKIVPIKNCLVSSRNGLMKCQGRYVTDLTKEV